MTNPDIGIYSNNNYVPDIGQFGHQPDIINNYTPMQNNQGGCNYPGNFTFAVPTSANQLTAGFTQTSQPAGLYSNTYMNPQQVVPGMGATWQHTVPNYMPWTDQVYGMVNSGMSRVSTFTGNSTVSQSYNTVPSPRPSCSGPARRNKRHATEDIEAGSPENKIFLTEEKMADRMQSLNIGTRNLSPPPIQPLPDVVLSSNMDAQYCKEAEGLQRLKELEKRLEDDVSESRDRENKRKEKPKLRLKLNLPEKVTASIFNPSPILPKKILEDINNSNLQVVLWKPPLGRPANSEKSHDQDTTDNDIDEPVIAMAEQDSDTLPSSPLFSLPEEDIDMDEDTMDLD
ncbi:uncharacterized protein LOC133196691 [Saccostrea echinata]|uniref:uncharacterized protein LOC133196691 n=1 Tax=Saccostrea echinata TaxID=191078 RepID=UPI002A815F2E|nr:uncharacterized protein LOC133196691 [Saccostrea echinata]XP_061188533.1 uncharacterized protein LOC133196691 [Saccostrea echinata]